jgi:tRNA 2-selenouridine synthase SelU
MANDFPATLNQIKKLAGKKYKADKLDKQIAAVDKLHGGFLKNYTSFTTARTSLEKAMLGLQDTGSKFTNLLKQMDNGIAGETFGLDSGNADDKKKIDQCRKLIDTLVTYAIKTNDGNNKNLDELDKHLENLSSYKGPQA